MDHKFFLNTVNRIFSKLVFDSSKIQEVHNETYSEDNRETVLKFIERVLKQGKDELQGMWTIRLNNNFPIILVFFFLASFDENGLKSIKRMRDELDVLYNVKKQKRSSTPATSLSFATESDLKEAGFEDLSEILSDEVDDDADLSEELDGDDKN